MPRRLGYLSPWTGLILVGLLLAGCATPPLDAARRRFYAGQYEQADSCLTNIPDGKDKVLFLMERGTVRQAQHDYEGSTADWLEAVRLEEDLETYSLSKGAASLVVNDLTLSFRGAPFERTLVHTFLLQNYMARSLWDDAAVEGRNVLERLEKLEGFPDDAFSRYLAGFSMEMINDGGNAQVQYRLASKLLDGIHVDEATGWIVPGSENEEGVAASAPRDGAHAPGKAELVCFVSIGRSPAGTGSAGTSSFAGAPYAEIYAGGAYLGRSYPLANTASLLAATQERVAALMAAKTVTRIAIKESVADAIRHHNEALGDLVALLLFSSEQPDTRRWETLPLWLEVARVPCPPNLASYDVVFKGAGSFGMENRRITTPLTRRGNVFVSSCRDLPPALTP